MLQQDWLHSELELYLLVSSTVDELKAVVMLLVLWQSGRPGNLASKLGPVASTEHGASDNLAGGLRTRLHGI